MKKLIMGAAIAVLAFAGQAATVDWKLTYADKGDTWSANGATVMAFAGSDFDEIVKLVTDTGSDTLQSDLASKSLGASTFVKSRSNAMANGQITSSPSSIFWMIFTEGSFDSGSVVTWTTSTDVRDAFYDPPSNGTAFSITESNFSGSGKIASVPEPTSGLLMLVGLAGLALRRRRA